MPSSPTLFDLNDKFKFPNKTYLGHNQYQSQLLVMKSEQ